MKITLKTEDNVDITLYIVFHRTRFGERRKVESTGKELIDTACIIYRDCEGSDISNGNLKEVCKVVVANERAYQSKRDNYNKIIGRKVALAKAIKRLVFLDWTLNTKRNNHRLELRKQIWAEFFMKFGWG